MPALCSCILKPVSTNDLQPATESYGSPGAGSKRKASSLGSSKESQIDAAASGTAQKKIPVALAKVWMREKHDPTGYFMSEKLDGMRLADPPAGAYQQQRCTLCCLSGLC